YGTAYVGCVSQADPAHLVKTMMEAEAYDGPSIIIAYAHCINHGISTLNGLAEQQKALDSGYWLLYSFNPDATDKKFKFNKKPIKTTLADFAAGENRFKQLKKLAPESYDKIIEAGQRDIEYRIARYEAMAENL
ncbi:MAG: pyruvate:ferredoxin (flavodoxin) oxidoreductase, partial [Armatimonadetes bacterium]|nr:pyruvate:ferredoxin (flavodoxin) oxidoreductase [Candidatus Hippobium faecium]